MIIQAVPYPATGGGSNPAYVTAENTGTTSIASGSGLTSLANLGSVGLDAASNYIGIFSAEALQNATSGSTESRVLVNGSTIHSTSMVADCRATNEQRSHGGIFFVQNPGSATSATVELQGAASGTGTATFQNRRLSMLKMGSNDAFAENLAAQAFTDTTANKTAQTAATLSFTPGSSGDYLIICSFIPRIDNSTNVYLGMQLSDGTNSTTEVGIRPKGGTQEPTVLMWHRTALSGAQIFSLKLRQTGSGGTTIGCAEVRFCAIRLDRFAHAYVATLGSDNSGTDTSYTSAHSQTFTPAATSHLTLCSFVHATGASGSGTAQARYSDGGTVTNEIISKGNFETAGNGGRPGFSHRLASYAASSRTQAIERMSASGTNLVRAGAVIATLDLAGL